MLIQVSLTNLKTMTKLLFFLNCILKSTWTCFIWDYSFLFIKDDTSCFPHKDGLCV